MECRRCHVIEDIKKAGDSCSIIMYDGKKSFLKILGKGHLGPFNPNEIGIPSCLLHSNILSINALKSSSDSLVSSGIGLIYNIADSDLNKWIIQNDPSFNDRLNIAFQLINSISAIHQSGYIHLDIKTNNFVIKENRVYLIDFGNSRKVFDSDRSIFLEQKKGTIYGTIDFMPPEALNHNGGLVKYSDKNDIFSLGLTILILLTSNKIFPKSVRTSSNNSVLEFYNSFFKNHKLLAKGIENMIDRKWKNYNKSIVELIARMISYSPEDRPSIEEVEKHLIWSRYTIPDSPIIAFENTISSNSLIKDDDLRNDVIYIVNFYREKLKKLPCLAMFLSVNIYYRSVNMIKGFGLLNKRKYISAASICLGISMCSINSYKDFTAIVNMLAVNLKYLEVLINDIIVFLRGMISNDFYYDTCKNSNDLRYVICNYFYQPEMYRKLKLQLPVFLEKPKGDGKKLTIEELDY